MNDFDRQENLNKINISSDTRYQKFREALVNAIHSSTFRKKIM